MLRYRVALRATAPSDVDAGPTHRRPHVPEKLGVTDRTEAATLALELGIIHLDG